MDQPGLKPRVPEAQSCVAPSCHCLAPSLGPQGAALVGPGGVRLGSPSMGEFLPSSSWAIDVFF